MMSAEEIQRGLQGHRLEVVAAETGLSYNTIRRLATGRAEQPHYTTLRLVSEWLTANAGRETAAAR